MDEQLPEIDSAIAEYYRQAPEERRLEEGAFLLESLRTRELIERHAPASPATVVDIGGAAGAYALWLAEAGYSVHLLDPIPRLVAEAERRSVAAPRPLASCAVGDARNLPFPDQTADLVLLLGPLYHLTAAQDRAGALDEAARVLKPGGCLFAAAVSRWASALDGLARDLFEDPQFAAIVARTCATVSTAISPGLSTTSPPPTSTGRRICARKCWTRGLRWWGCLESRGRDGFFPTLPSGWPMAAVERICCAWRAGSNRSLRCWPPAHTCLR
jgi:SAM-dependent methyltransferase